IDVRRSLLSLASFEDGDVRARLDWPTGPLMRFTVSVSHEGSARPSEIVRVLFGDDAALDADLARLAIWAGEAGDATIDPLRVAVLRRRPPLAAPGAGEGDPVLAAAP